MKAVILAGGLGTRISEETHLKPKPMIEIGGMPILWHIMKIYSNSNVKDFIICCGYKGYMIKEFFANYAMHTSDVTFNLKKNEIIFHKTRTEDWKVTLVDTGLDSMTGGRLLRVSKYLEKEDLFCFTYGDGVGNINIDKLIKFHKSHKKIATLTATYPPGRFGAVKEIEDKVISFDEKPRENGGLINAGFFVLSYKAIKYIKDDFTDWENESLVKLAKDNQLMAFKHYDFWHPMDTMRDKNLIDSLWKKNKAPWKVWND